MRSLGQRRHVRVAGARHRQSVSDDVVHVRAAERTNVRMRLLAAELLRVEEGVVVQVAHFHDVYEIQRVRCVSGFQPKCVAVEELCLCESCANENSG